MKDKTKLAALGRPHTRPAHPVNMPVERASTILFPTYDDFLEGARTINYGRLGTSSHRALEEAINSLEGGFETRLAPSGLQACNASILAFVSAGDHVLMTDAAYDPTRKFCEKFLARFGVETTFYDPTISKDDLEKLVRPTTKVIFAESPGSLTFEVQDIPAFVEVAQKYGAKLIVDNTWSGGYFYKPIAHGADVSIQAATKYIGGHSDCLIGSITSADEAVAKKIYYALLQLGSNVSADDAYLALRGLRTLAQRLEAHQANAQELARWLRKRPEVKRVMYPGFKDCPGHAIWKRDFTGASGLFGVVLEPMNDAAIRAFFNAFKLVGMGFSWGGFESLCVHVHPERYRTASEWSEEGVIIRVHAGLEDVDEIKDDFSNAFSAMAKYIVSKKGRSS